VSVLSYFVDPNGDFVALMRLFQADSADEQVKVIGDASIDQLWLGSLASARERQNERAGRAHASNKRGADGAR